MLFEEIHYRNDKNLLGLDNCNIIFRKAVRAVIIDKNKILMAHLEKIMKKYLKNAVQLPEYTEKQ